MAVIKCKMCGGDLIIEPDSTVAECEYCGSRQTVPTADNEKKLTLFARANRLRAACEFDKAAGIYETIVADFPEEAEAYWGLVLCKYGIEYVDDPATGKKIPTCHRSGFDSVLEDGDFEQACENADAIARRVYREEAKQIEELRKGIIEVSGKEEPYDIFICYKETDENGERTIDSVIAQDVYDALTDKGYRVFFSRITLEDKLGQEYEPYIFAALNSARIMLAFGTDYEYYNAVWVKNEWSRYLKLMAADKTKHLIPCYKGIDAYDMPKEFARLQAQDMGKVGAMQDLMRGIEKILPKNQPAIVVQEKLITEASASPGTAPLLRRGNLFLEDRDWDNANVYFDKVLDLDPECAEAYLGKLMAELQVSERAALASCAQPFVGNGNCLKALRFGSETLKEELTGYNNACWERVRQEQERQKQQQERQKQQQERQKQQQEWQKQVREQQERVRQERLHKGCTQAASASKLIAAGADHTVGLKTDGTVVSAGRNADISSWQGIVAVSAGSKHTIGLKTDGTMVAIGSNASGRCEVSDWRDIEAISAGECHTVGLKRNGTVVAVGQNWVHQCDVSSWRNIVAVSAGANHIVGLKKDGTVVATGSNYFGQLNVSDWRDIVAVSAGFRHTVGLRFDGTVVATGNNDSGQCNVKSWRDIVAVSAGGRHTVGLKRDGTVVAVGVNEKGQCNVNNWKLFNNLDALEQERAEQKARRVAELEQQKAALQTELSGLKGVFTGKRRREIEAQLAQIEKELKGLN